METQLVDEILECLVGERTLFYYYPDRYAVVMLQRLLCAGEQRIVTIKQSALGKLLNKPIMQKVMASKGNGKLAASDLQVLWPLSCNAYVLTLGRWGSRADYRWDQISRPGENLVLQLNFSRQHDRHFDRATGIDSEDFNDWGHPTSDRGRSTLAWARMDIDLESGQALIEEIQTDWLRDVKTLYQCNQKAKQQNKDKFRFWGYDVPVVNAQDYCLQTLQQHRQWSEAMLTAALQFLWQEVGVYEIYYHSFETGKALKNIRYDGPPRSLYTDLPRRFCFTEVARGPNCIEACKAARKRLKKVKQPAWFRLAI